MCGLGLGLVLGLGLGLGLGFKGNKAIVIALEFSFGCLSGFTNLYIYIYCYGDVYLLDFKVHDLPNFARICFRVSVRIIVRVRVRETE